MCYILGDTTNETVALMEDSLMVLGSLLSNRFAQKLLAFMPFKPFQLLNELIVVNLTIIYFITPRQAIRT